MSEAKPGAASRLRAKPGASVIFTLLHALASALPLIGTFLLAPIVGAELRARLSTSTERPARFRAALLLSLRVALILLGAVVGVALAELWLPRAGAVLFGVAAGATFGRFVASSATETSASLAAGVGVSSPSFGARLGRVAIFGVLALVIAAIAFAVSQVADVATAYGLAGACALVAWPCVVADEVQAYERSPRGRIGLALGLSLIAVALLGLLAGRTFVPLGASEGPGPEGTYVGEAGPYENVVAPNLPVWIEVGRESVRLSVRDGGGVGSVYMAALSRVVVYELSDQTFVARIEGRESTRHMRFDRDGVRLDDTGGQRLLQVGWVLLVPILLVLFVLPLLAPRFSRLGSSQPASS